MRFIQSFVFAGRGLWFCLRHERNFRVHLTAAVYVLLLAPYFALGRGEWAALLLVLAMVLAAEAVNTAVEQAVNLASPYRRTRARVAKDVAAGAVLLCSLAAVGVGAALFWQPAAWRTLWADFVRWPVKPALLALSVPLAVWFIACGGRRRAKAARKPLTRGPAVARISGNDPGDTTDKEKKETNL